MFMANWLILNISLPDYGQLLNASLTCLVYQPTMAKSQLGLTDVGWV
jgi:hypothetical protein